MGTNNPFLDVIRMQMQYQAQRRLLDQELRAKERVANLQSDTAIRTTQMAQEGVPALRDAQKKLTEAQTTKTEQDTKSAAVNTTIGALGTGMFKVEGPIEIEMPDGTKLIADPELIKNLPMRDALAKQRAAQIALDMEMEFAGFDPKSPEHRTAYAVVSTALKPRDDDRSLGAALTDVKTALSAIDGLGSDAPSLKYVRKLLETRETVLSDRLNQLMALEEKRMGVEANRTRASSVDQELDFASQQAVARILDKVYDELGRTREGLSGKGEMILGRATAVLSDPAFRAQLQKELGLKDREFSIVKGRVYRWMVQQMVGGQGVAGILNEAQNASIMQGDKEVR